jgi:hypothetical protein
MNYENGDIIWNMSLKRTRDHIELKKEMIEE